MGLADNRLLHIKILSQTWSKRSSPLFLASQCTSSVHGTNMASDSCAYCVCAILGFLWVLIFYWSASLSSSSHTVNQGCWVTSRLPAVPGTEGFPSPIRTLWRLWHWAQCLTDRIAEIVGQGTSQLMAWVGVISLSQQDPSLSWSDSFPSLEVVSTSGTHTTLKKK